MTGVQPIIVIYEPQEILFKKKIILMDVKIPEY